MGVVSTCDAQFWRRVSAFEHQLARTSTHPVKVAPGDAKLARAADNLAAKDKEEADGKVPDELDELHHGFQPENGHEHLRWVVADAERHEREDENSELHRERYRERNILRIPRHVVLLALGLQQLVLFAHDHCASLRLLLCLRKDGIGLSQPRIRLAGLALTNKRQVVRASLADRTFVL